MKHTNLSPLFKRILLFLDREKEPKAPTTERKSGTAYIHSLFLYSQYFAMYINNLAYFRILNSERVIILF